MRKDRIQVPDDGRGKLVVVTSAVLALIQRMFKEQTAGSEGHRSVHKMPMIYLRFEPDMCVEQTAKYLLIFPGNS
jgi:hypothetical protein